MDRLILDEAIAYEKKDSEPCSILCTHATNRNECIECRAYHKQLHKWLEELKELRVIFGKIIREIDELQNYACFPTEWVSCEQSEVHTYYAKELTKILKLAEQLKAGGTDE